MATVLDLSLLYSLKPVITFLLIFTITYGVFVFSKLFGDNKVLQAFLAFLLAFIGSLTPAVVVMVEFMTPWFTIFFIFLVFSLVIFKIFGATDENLHMVIRKSVGLQYLLIAFAIIIGIGALTQAFGAPAAALTGPVEDGGFLGGNVAPIFFHPKVLGMVFLLLIAAVAIRLLTSKLAPDWP